MTAAKVSPALTVWLEGIGFIAPGLPDWPAARAVLRGEQAYVSAPSVLPAPQLLPAAERRRASRVVKLALALGTEAAAHAQCDTACLATVFAASGADGHNCHALCEQLATDDRQISPTRFHNSVHNAAAGYWGIATRSMAPCQVLCAFDASFGAGLLDAIAQVRCDGEPVLLIAYDSEYPEPLHAVRDTPDAAGVALVLRAERSEQSIASLRLSFSDEAASVMADADLESLRRRIPSLRSLPLLRQLALGEAGTVGIDYLAPRPLMLTVTPC